MIQDGLQRTSARLFSNPAGDYGSMVNERVGASTWEDGAELGDTWASRNAFSYGRCVSACVLGSDPACLLLHQVYAQGETMTPCHMPSLLHVHMTSCLRHSYVIKLCTLPKEWVGSCRQPAVNVNMFKSGFAYAHSCSAEHVACWVASCGPLRQVGI